MDTDPTPAEWDLIDAVPMVNGPGVMLWFRRHDDPESDPETISYRSIVAAQRFTSTAGFPDPLDRYLAHRAATDPTTHSVPLPNPTKPSRRSTEEPSPAARKRRRPRAAG